MKCAPNSICSGLRGCFLLPVTSYETLDKTRSVMKPQFPHGKNTNGDCWFPMALAFPTYFPKDRCYCLLRKATGRW